MRQPVDAFIYTRPIETKHLALGTYDVLVSLLPSEEDAAGAVDHFLTGALRTTGKPSTAPLALPAHWKSLPETGEPPPVGECTLSVEGCQPALEGAPLEIKARFRLAEPAPLAWRLTVFREGQQDRPPLAWHYLVLPRFPKIWWHRP